MRRFMLCLLLLAACGGTAEGGLTTTFQPILGHQYFPGDPLRTQWANTMIAAAQSGTQSGNYETDPLAVSFITAQGIAPKYYVFSDASQASPQHMWEGQADPSGTFSTAMGSGIYWLFGLKGDGSTKIKLANVSDNGIFRSGYGFSAVGIQYGADGKLGGGDDTTLTSGNASTPVDAIFGFTSTLQGRISSTNGSGPAWQADITSAIAAAESSAPFQVSNNPFKLYSDDAHTVVAADLSSPVTVHAPEPASLSLLALGGMALLGRRRRTRRSVQQG